MHDDGARQTSRALEPPGHAAPPGAPTVTRGPDRTLAGSLASMRRSASVLQGVQSAVAIVSAAPLAVVAMRRLPMGVPAPLNRLSENAGASVWFVWFEGVLWAWWVLEIHHVLGVLGLRPCGQSTLAGLAGALFPPLGWYGRWREVAVLTRSVEPGRLPAVRVPFEHSGGFREDVVAWAPLPAASAPRLTLWRGLWSLGFFPFYLLLLALLLVSGGQSLLGTDAVAAFCLPMLSGRMLVSGVTANAGELARRSVALVGEQGRHGAHDP